MSEVVVHEFEYKVRDAFKDFHKRKQRWAVLVCHRRAGKTVASINDLIKRAIKEEKPDGRYFYLCPLYSQAKSVAWDYLLRFAAIISGCNNWLEIAKNLRFSNQEINYLRAILKPNFIINLQINNTDLEELLFDYKKEIIIDNLILNLIQTAINDQKIIEFLSLKYSILGKKLPDFPLNGNDLLKLKISPERIGYFLKIGRKYWIENNYLPNSTQIMNFIKISY